MTRAALRSERIDWYDGFDRSDGILGRDWISGHTLAPARFEEVGIYDGAFVCTDPTSRAAPEDYQPEDDTSHPPANGKIYAGIGFAARWMPPTWTPDVEITWSGLWGLETGHHVETAPLLWIDPTNPLCGVGAWTSSILGGSVIFLGYMGSPPELFGEDLLIEGIPIPGHVDGTPQRTRLAEVEPGKVGLWVDGVRLSSGSVDAWDVDESLLGNQLHGIAMDAHMVRPYSDIPSTPAVLDVRYRNVVAP